MSTLLSELALDYEILADDPIEMGIHFGQSILNHVHSGLDSVRSYSSEVVSEISSTANRAVTFVQHPKQVEIAPIGAPISLAGRALKPRSSLGAAPSRSTAIDYRRRQTVNTGVRPIQGRGAVGYKPRAYASRSTFLVGGM